MTVSPKMQESEHHSSLSWRRGTADFSYEAYNRSHEINFGAAGEGTQAVRASSARQYLGDPALANPEELLAASASSCHMLTFLAIAARSRLVVDSYEDHATALLAPRPDGRMAVTRVTLRPRIVFAAGSEPTKEKLKELHEKSHRNCFIANTLACKVVVEGFTE